MFLPLTGMPILKSARNKHWFAVWLPEPLTVAATIVKLLTPAGLSCISAGATLGRTRVMLIRQRAFLHEAIGVLHMPRAAQAMVVGAGVRKRLASGRYPTPCIIPCPRICSTRGVMALVWSHRASASYSPTILCATSPVFAGKPDGQSVEVIRLVPMPAKRRSRHTGTARGLFTIGQILTLHLKTSKSTCGEIAGLYGSCLSPILPLL